MHKLIGHPQRFIVIFGSAIAMACTAPGSAGKGPDAAGSADSAAMARGVDLMYKSNDPVGAEAAFREVLQRTPTHYGARYQLAVALDREGKPELARLEWEAAQKNADAVGDTTTSRIARARLAAPDTSSQEALMIRGLQLMRVEGNPGAAADLFRKILQKTPTHYGATYQLAVALDKSGKTDEARVLWERVLGMATGYKDTETAKAARQRLSTPR